MKKIFSEETRRRMSEAAKARCSPEWRAAKSAEYSSAIDDAKLRELYESGMTQDEVAAAMGVSQKVIFNAMRRLGIPRRRRIKRNQTGSANSSWRGDEATYAAIHRRVEAARGKPSKCESCGAEEGRFEWANQTGKYTDVNDFKRLCVSCHKRFDNSRRGDGELLSAHVPRRRKKVQHAS